jgi:hypothetical protein
LRFDDACAQLDKALIARNDIIEALMKGSAGGAPFSRLRAAMRSHTFQTGTGTLSLRHVVEALDGRARGDGLHVLQAWDFQSHRFSEDIAPVLQLDYCIALRRVADDRMTAAILLDAYFQAILSLLAVSAWIEGDPNANLDRVTALLRTSQQGSGTSGLSFGDHAETQLFLAASYYHPVEACYGRLLERVRALDEAHRLRVARACAAMLSAHLRWGFRFMYERDVARMRDDNVVDYPWLAFALETLARERDRPGAESSAEPLLLALAADPWGCVPQLAIPPEPLTRQLEGLQPRRGVYSPLAFTCNFPSNAVVALVAVSIEDGRVWPSLDTLWHGKAGAELAERMMKFSASDPNRLGHRGAPLVVHDPAEEARAWNAVMRELKGSREEGPGNGSTMTAGKGRG